MIKLQRELFKLKTDIIQTKKKLKSGKVKKWGTTGLTGIAVLSGLYTIAKQTGVLDKLLEKLRQPQQTQPSVIPQGFPTFMV
jgi:hypothetical protein